MNIPSGSFQVTIPMVDYQAPLSWEENSVPVTVSTDINLSDIMSQLIQEGRTMDYLSR